MKLSHLITLDKKEITKECFAYARSVNFKITELYNEAENLWFTTMRLLKSLEDGSDIQNELYEKTFKLSKIIESLEDWK
jgi:hypothetical protein